MFAIDLHGLRKYLQDTQVAGSKEYVIIPLLGRFKNELGNQYHLTPLVAQTKLGLKVKQWVQRLVEAHALEGRTRGGTFTEQDGSVRYTWYEREILDRFQTIQQRHPDIIPADVQVLEEYGLSRSFCRGATSEARARGTNAADIDVANRWRAFEEAKGHRPRLAMRDHYADISLLIPAPPPPHYFMQAPTLLYQNPTAGHNTIPFQANYNHYPNQYYGNQVNSSHIITQATGNIPNPFVNLNTPPNNTQKMNPFGTSQTLRKH